MTDMKKIVLSIVTILIALNAGAQGVYLSKAYKPVDSRKYNPHYKGVRGEEETSAISNFKYTNGFSLRNGVLNDQAVEFAYAEFSLGGQYEKISFVMGRKSPVKFLAGDDGSHIVTVKADGRRILDEVVHDYDPPKEYVLDITGVDKLLFQHWKGLESIDFEEVRLWKKGETPVKPANPLASVISKDKVNLVEELEPHAICHRGWSKPITQKYWSGVGAIESIKMNRISYTSGLEMSCSQELGKGISSGFAYFWLQRAFDKVSFLIGPRDNMSSNAQGWFTVKADGKIIYEKLITQQDLVERVTLDVKGVNLLSMHTGELEQSDFLGGLTYGVVDIYAYKKGVPVEESGVANTAKDRLSKLPDAVPLCSNIEPYSIRGKGSYNDIYFKGESSYYHFSMGGEQFDEGFILTSGSTFMDGNIDSYVMFDLAGEFDWISFKAGTLSKRRVLDEDRLLVYADDVLILDTRIHALWPNQQFTLPIGKCRTLKFAKPGTGKDKQTFTGIGDAILFRGEPKDPAPYFYHRKPESPDEVDLIDYTGGPYFHYVGRYLSSLTNFDFNDCYKNGSSLKDSFHMKDGSLINKGIMLETNVPPALAFEDIDLNTAIFLFVAGAGSAMSASNVAAATGVSAGAGLAGALAAGYSSLNLVGDSGHQSSMAAFNPFGEYESLTFTVANKAEFVDTDLFGAKLHPANPVKMYVFADMVKVGEYILTNQMQPTTYTVPINRCTQLVFWLECGETRSGQYVLYDMTLSKTPYVAPQPVEVSEPAEETLDKASSSKSSKGGRKAKAKKEKAQIVWDFDGSHSRNEAIDIFLADVTAVWDETQALKASIGAGYKITETYVRTMSGEVYKCVSFVDGSGNRLSTTDLQRKILDEKNAAAGIPGKATLAQVGLPGATVGIMNLPTIEAMTYYGKYVKQGTAALSQCSNESKQIVELKQMELEAIQSYLKQAVNVGDKKSNARVVIVPLAPGEAPAPGTKMQMLEYYTM